MKKKIYILLLAVAVFAVVIYFLPKPICSDNIEEIIQIQVNFNYGEENSKLENVHFIPKKVIECIEKYKEQRTLSFYNGYRMKNVEMHIDFRTTSGTKSIVIGNEIYSFGSEIKNRILDAENFRKDMFDACGVPLNEETNRIMAKEDWQNTEKSFVGTVLEETTSYMLVEPDEDEEERKIADKIKIDYGTDHMDYLYGTGRKVAIYYQGEIEITSPAVIKSNDISTEGFREFELLITPSEEKEKVLAISKDIFYADTKTLTADNSIDYNVYLYGIDNFDVKVDGKIISAKDALAEGKISINGIISKCNRDAAQRVIDRLVYRGGGSVVFKYPDYTVIKYNTPDGNRDVYIGTPDMDREVINK